MNSNQLLDSFHRSFTIRLVFSVLLGLSFNLGGARADTPSLADRVIEHRLGNGMTVLMVERHQTPVVSINLTFGVGGMNEQVGQTGLAHLYEHMAFKGTRTVGTKDYEKEQAVLEELHRVGAELEQYQGGESGAVAPGSDGAQGPSTARIEALRQRFKELQDKAGEYRFRFKASNGETMFSSEGYKAKASAIHAIESIKRNSPAADTVDLTAMTA